MSEPTLLHGDEHKPEKWYTECSCVDPEEALDPESMSSEEWCRLVDEFFDAHTDLYDGDDYLGRGCDLSYTDTRCSTCSHNGDYPDVVWPCRARGWVEGGTP